MVDLKTKKIDDAVVWYQEERKKYKRFSLKMELLLKEILDEQGITYYEVSSRCKDVKSFKEKVEKKGYENPKDEIFDFSGIRVITYVESEVNKVSEVIDNEFYIIEEHSVDKTKELNDDQFGYRSVHYVAKLNDERSELPEYNKYQNIPFEIQVRTLLQHAWAEIEHDRSYKLKEKLPENLELKRRFHLLAANLELADREFDKIVNDIENYTQQIHITTGSKTEINPVTLEKYFYSKIKGKLDLINDEKKIDEIIFVLQLFNISSIEDFDLLITPEFISKYKEYYEGTPTFTFSLFVQDVLMFTNIDKYLSTIFPYLAHWTAMDEKDYNFYKSIGIDIDKAIENGYFEIYKRFENTSEKDE
ncbi:RelA/SpoT domain-containing protein [Lysinibacillus sp. CTST325]